MPQAPELPTWGLGQQKEGPGHLTVEAWGSEASNILCPFVNCPKQETDQGLGLRQLEIQPISCQA